MPFNYTSLLPPLDPKENKSTVDVTYKISQLAPKESKLMWTSNIREVTMIRMDSPGILAKVKPLTLHTVFQDAVHKAGKHVAFKYKFSQEDKFMDITFEEYYRLSCMAAKSFIKLGLQTRNSVCISGFNSPPWVLSFIGSIFAGGVASGVYTTNNLETVVYILNNCSCQIAVVQDDELLKRYVEAAKESPKLEAIIQYSGTINEDIKSKTKVKLYEFKEFMQLGADVPDSTLIARLQGLLPNECCSLIYTSGTTGNPKGVMMSHDNLTWTSKCMCDLLGFRLAQEHYISYLPLSHVAGQICDIMIPLFCHATMYFAQPDALKGTLGKTIKEVHPTFFIGVPRVYEKIAEQMKEIGLTMSSTKQKISAWAKDVGLKTNLAVMNHDAGPFGYTVAKHLIYNKVRNNIGFDRCLGLFSAAAPLSHEMLHYFASLNLVICEIYGMSECSGPHSVGLHREFRFGTVGKVFSEVSNKLESLDKNSNEGEICMRGRHVFMGYVGAKDKTEEVFDKDNWLHSGDIGALDSDGYLTITGRIKELIITAGGENIAPIPIENYIKEYAQIISNAVVIGEKKKFLSVLLTIKCIINPDTQMPTDVLTPVSKRWCESLGYKVETVSKIIEEKDPRVWAAIDEAIKEANKKAVSAAAQVKKWRFLTADLTVGGGELGPTMKLKRNVVMSMYAKVIDELYAG